MTGADCVIKFLEKHVDHVFTVSGGGSIFLCDSLTRSTIKTVCCHHEQAAGYAAEAYSRIRGMGVCLVTSGPGGTNAVSACAAAWLDSIPLIFISGQAFLSQTITNHPGLRQLGVQEINIVDIVKPITKYAVMLTKAVEIGEILHQALFMAKDLRPGPVWIDIPGDIQNARM